MIARELISNNIPPLKTTDSGDKALNWMSDFHVDHLPIIENGELIGLISEDDILDLDQPELPIKAYNLSLRKPYIAAQEHIYEVIKKVVNLQLSVIPVIENDQTYIGLITHESLLNYFAQSASLQQPGAVLILEINSRDYSMGEIARIVESEGASILSCLVTSSIDAAMVEVTLKINRQNLGGVINAFQRFKYIVKASFQENDYTQSLQERYDSLMHYLNV
jgi:predicted transcriptional regulator